MTSRSNSLPALSPTSSVCTRKFLRASFEKRPTIRIRGPLLTGIRFDSLFSGAPVTITRDNFLFVALHQPQQPANVLFMLPRIVNVPAHRHRFAKDTLNFKTSTFALTFSPPHQTDHNKNNYGLVFLLKDRSGARLRPAVFIRSLRTPIGDRYQVYTSI